MVSLLTVSHNDLCEDNVAQQRTIYLLEMAVEGVPGRLRAAGFIGLGIPPATQKDLGRTLNTNLVHSDCVSTLPEQVRHHCGAFPGSVAEQGPRPCLLYTSPSPRDRQKSRMPSSA